MNKFVFLFLLLSFSFGSAQGRLKNYNNILNSTSIYEIDAFLRDAHIDDPKRSILKPKLIKMLKEYISNAKPGDQRVKDYQEKLAILRRKPSTKISFDDISEMKRQGLIAKYQKELKTANANVENYKGSTTTAATNASKSAANTSISTNTSTSATANAEDAEFQMLMSENPIDHKNKTVKILNSLFDNDPTAKESIVMIENKSDCNIIMRIEGVGHTKYRLAIPAKSDNTIVVAKGDYLFTSIVCGAQYASQKTVQKALMVALGSSSK